MSVASKAVKKPHLGPFAAPISAKGPRWVGTFFVIFFTRCKKALLLSLRQEIVLRSGYRDNTPLILASIALGYTYIMDGNSFIV